MVSGKPISQSRLMFLLILGPLWACWQMQGAEATTVSGTLHAVEVVHPAPSRRLFSHRHVLQPSDASLRTVPIEGSHTADPRYRERRVSMYGAYKAGVFHAAAAQPHGALGVDDPLRPQTPTVLAIAVTETDALTYGAYRLLADMITREMDAVSTSLWRPNVTVRHANVGRLPGCDYEGATDRAFELLGVAPDAYSYVSILLPTTFGQHSGANECVLDGTAWKGLAYLGGKYSWVRLASDSTAEPIESRIWGHELLHNIGIGHSMTPGDEYGDATCVMGNLFSHRHGITLNGAALAQLGWHRLHPESERLGRVTLRPLGTSNEIFTIGPHIVSFRHTLAGRDATLAGDSGVSIHRTAGHKRILLAHGRGEVTAENLTIAVQGFSPELVTFDVTRAVEGDRAGYATVAAAAAVLTIAIIGKHGSNVRARGDTSARSGCPRDALSRAVYDGKEFHIRI